MVYISIGEDKMKIENNWSECPRTEMKCSKCGTIWKLKKSIGCPKCDGTDGGLDGE